MRIVKKTVKKKEYYYLEESLRLEKPKVYAMYLGRKKPGRENIKKYESRLLDKIYDDLLKGAERIYLTREQLIGFEKKRRVCEERMKKFTKKQRDEKDEIDAVDFVYTTLATEGIPVTKKDADLAYKFSKKNIRGIRDENLRTSLDMIKGLRKIKESRKGISLGFILDLHKTIMSNYGEKSPGKFRTKQAYIYLKSFEKVEEIRFRPPAPSELKNRISTLVEWYNARLNKLNPIELAALLHLRFYAIHPFEDGNKRVSRLLLNKAFYDAGYSILNVSHDTEKYFDTLIKAVEKKDESAFAVFVLEEFNNKLATSLSHAPKDG